MNVLKRPSLCIFLRIGKNRNSSFSESELLKDIHVKKCMERFKMNRKHQKKWKDNAKAASVFIILCRSEEKLSIIYTKRTTGLSYSAQISFPGGMRDSGENVEEAAMRETREEIGLNLDKINVWGSGYPLARNGILITPVVGFFSEDVTADSFKLNEKEVEYAFVIPLETFCHPSCFRYTRFKNSYTLPVFLVNNHKIWGITAVLTHIFLTCFLPKSIYRHYIKMD